MDRYKKLLHYFCRLNADLAKTYESLTYGECPCRELLETVEDLTLCKEALLKEKELLGLKGGISFLEDFSFDTGNPLEERKVTPVFGIKDGLFFGEKDLAFPVLMKWYESPEEDIKRNPYKYEKAVFLLSLLFWGNEEMIHEEVA